MKKSFILPLFVFLSCSAPKTNQEYSNAISRSQIIVRELMENNKTQGMAVSVSRDGKMVWSEGFGYSDA